MKLFAQIRKVDEEKRLVFGRAAEEAVDKAKESMDYMASKPHFQKWSADIAKASDGANLGNVRAMHGKVAAGKLTAIDFDDTGKTIDVCAKVVDDAEWKKVQEGVYTGFSIGGAYADKRIEKMGGHDVTRYTAIPSEISLVDSPCMHGAKFFEVQKADGTLAKVEFRDPEPDPVDVTGTTEQILEFGKLMNENGLSMGDVLKAMPAFIADKVKAKDAAADDGEKDADGKPKKKPPVAADDASAQAEKLAKVAAAKEFFKADPDVGKKSDEELVTLHAAAVAELAKRDAAADESLTKLEAALTDALAKAGARNSASDAARIAKIHDMAVELGHDCAGAAAAKAAATGDLTKVDNTEALQKLVAAAVEPLQKALDAATQKITKLEAQPAPARISLRAIAKVADAIDDPAAAPPAAPKPITDDHGDVHEAAGLIKFIHAGGGTPMAMPLRK